MKEGEIMMSLENIRGLRFDLVSNLPTLSKKCYNSCDVNTETTIRFSGKE